MRIWLARFCVFLVFFVNIQCAISFLWQPGAFASSYELTGEVGAAVIRGIAVLFIMWNVPYAVALWHPLHYRLSLWQAAVMQGIGVLGEALIFFSLSNGHALLRSSIERFLVFDGAGFGLLLLAIWLGRKPE